MTPLISIVIPFHNSESNDRSKLMDRLVESVPQRQDIEILLVDDFSAVPYTPKDTRAQVIPQISGRRYAGEARKTGIEAAKGTWIVMADSDDVFTTGFHEICQNLETETADQVLFLSDSSFEDGAPAERNLSPNKSTYLFWKTQDHRFLTNHFVPWARAIKKEFILKNQLNFAQRRYANDVEFAVHLATLKPETTVVPIVGYRVLDGRDSLMTSFSKEAFQNRFDVHLKSNQMLVKAGWSECQKTYKYMIKKWLTHRPIDVTLFVLKLLATGNFIWRINWPGVKEVEDTWPITSPALREKLTITPEILFKDK